MKLEDCKIGMKVRILDKTIWGRNDSNGNLFPALARGWGYLKSKYSGVPENVYLAKTLEGLSEPGAYSPNDLEPYIEEGQEYRQLKDITPRAIYDDRNVSDTASNCFMREFSRFINTFDVQYDETVLFENNLELDLNTEPEWTDWLVKHGFIEKVVGKEWKKIGIDQAGELQPGIEVKRIYDGYEALLTIVSEPQLVYRKSFKRKMFTYVSKSSFGRIDLHYLSDLFNGDVYILTEGK